MNINSNIVDKKNLTKVQLTTLEILKDALVNSFGPMGSNTSIILQPGVLPKYTKDGHDIIEQIKFNGVIEASIRSDIFESTNHVVKNVGDGTTSTVILSYLIFKSITENEKIMQYSPAEIMRVTRTVVDKITNLIMEKKHEATLEDIYNVALIATNGNTDIANQLKAIYEEYGMDVFIDVNTANTDGLFIKAYDGMTLNSGFADIAYINTSEKTCEIKNPRIYAFRDPIDNKEMIALFDSIIQSNIISPYMYNMDLAKAKQVDRKNNKPFKEYIPTVILAPKLTDDMSAYFMQLITMIKSIPETQRPPLLVVTNIYNQDIFDDICLMSNTKQIHKYLDPKIQDEDIKKGLAPTVENVALYCGSAELVIADDNKTKFINPSLMFETDENGERVYSRAFNELLDFLNKSLDKAREEGKDAHVVGNIKRRINSLKSNMVDLYVGGISAADRESLRTSIEDAVLNCRSSATDGVGYGANFEGLRAAQKQLANASTRTSTNSLEEDISEIFYKAYYDLAKILYSSVLGEDNAEAAINKSLFEGVPMNLVTKEYDGTVLSSIKSDPIVLETIAKILTIMITCNQALVPTPQHNLYVID